MVVMFVIVVFVVYGTFRNIPTVESAGGAIEMDRPITNCQCLPPPPKRRMSPLISVATNRAAVPSPGRFTEH
jgi:hypothetical protein